MTPTIMTQGSIVFDVASPDTQHVHIADIAHALSNICRFNGHTLEHYSVAQHSVLVSYQVPKEFELQGLLHDAAEAYIGDIATPLKRLLHDYLAIERKVEAAVFAAFGLPAMLHPSVKHADAVVLATEVRDLMPANADYWACLSDIQPLPSVIRPMTNVHAEMLFLNRFAELTAGATA